jgi:hypothetical protein
MKYGTERQRILLAQRLVRYFQENEGETLMTKDIAIRYDVPADEVPRMLARAVDRQWLRREGNGVGGRGHQSTYSLGASPPALMPELDRTLELEDFYRHSPEQAAASLRRAVRALRVIAVGIRPDTMLKCRKKVSGNELRRLASECLAQLGAGAPEAD